jgi:hypothetical protein
VTRATKNRIETGFHPHPRLPCGAAIQASSLVGSLLSTCSCLRVAPRWPRVMTPNLVERRKSPSSSNTPSPGTASCRASNNAAVVEALRRSYVGIDIQSPLLYGIEPNPEEIELE